MDETSGKQNYYPSPMATSTGPNPSPDGFPTQPGGPNPPQAGFQGPYAFSPEEIRVLRECNRESLLFRCIPLATITSALTYFGISRGYIKPSASFGVFPKVTLAAICGYVLGKLSYQRQCADMIAKLPNSKLADAIRKSRGLSVQLDRYVL
ncbi:OCIA domain-containing protein 1-like [Hyalella azteca]|uniref:OCIA domain-containing protein 1-like n=1 Tax=Hyalella azteca TaxID=294128 RepID=A0A8B7PIK8_HYAAZ|nr:OCIA domain-containing protein 1-like [Hyalella azteca]